MWTSCLPSDAGNVRQGTLQEAHEFEKLDSRPLVTLHVCLVIVRMTSEAHSRYTRNEFTYESTSSLRSVSDKHMELRCQGHDVVCQKRFMGEEREDVAEPEGPEVRVCAHPHQEDVVSVFENRVDPGRIPDPGDTIITKFTPDVAPHVQRMHLFICASGPSRSHSLHRFFFFVLREKNRKEGRKEDLFKKIFHFSFFIFFICACKRGV